MAWPRNRKAVEVASLGLDIETLARQRATAAMKREYSRGLADGILLLANHIENTPDAEAPDGAYTGPLPEELTAFLTRVRLQAEALRREEG